jgi:riboflavin synthase
MFSGIIEATGVIEKLIPEQHNLHLFVRAPFAHEIKVDQSIAHNGVCLTVVGVQGDIYKVTAVSETLEKTNLGGCKLGDELNLERCIRLGDRLDGHLVQGHVDETATCKLIEPMGGSWKIHFEYPGISQHITVNKGSICVNGVSLTVVDSNPHEFSVAVIPYTWEHTNFRLLKPGDKVNLEFDIVGKYISKLMERR